MSSPFIMLDTDVTGSGVFIDLNRVRPLFPTYAEAEAEAHWLLGADRPTHGDLVSQQPLTLTGPAPALQTGHVQWDTAQGAGAYAALQTPQRVALNVTNCVVFKRTAARDYGMVCGSWDPGEEMEVLWIDAGGYKLLTRSEGGAINSLALPAPAGTAVGEWSFLAYSASATGVRVWWDGVETQSAHVKRVIADRPFKIGPAHAAAYGLTAVAEFIRIPRVLTGFECAAIKARSRIRLQPRGVVLD